jgi:hypothetical protein
LKNALKVSLKDLSQKVQVRVSAELEANCYSGSVRRNRADTATIAGISEVTAERVRRGGEILRGLAQAVAEGEERQRRFRNAVVIRLSRIETIVQMIHAGQIVDAEWRKPAYERKIETNARGAEE